MKIRKVGYESTRQLRLTVIFCETVSPRLTGILLRPVENELACVLKIEVVH